jgi:hypothetical protein
MDDDGVILRINDCLTESASDGRRQYELLEICQENLHLTGNQLFNAFRGHLDMATLRSLASTWDTWRGLLSNHPHHTAAKRSTSRTTLH